jgi:hypothetical protein
VGGLLHDSVIGEWAARRDGAANVGLHVVDGRCPMAASSADAGTA